MHCSNMQGLKIDSLNSDFVPRVVCSTDNQHTVKHENINKEPMWTDIASALDMEHCIKLSNLVYESKTNNYNGCRAPVPSFINVNYLNQELCDYTDKQIIEFLTYGWPIYFTGSEPSTCQNLIKNHKGATEFENQIDAYIKREIETGSTLGPFDSNPLTGKLFTSSLNSVDKKGSGERRVILDLSFPPGQSINDGIPQGEYLGQSIELSYPTVDDFVNYIRQMGKGCKLYKRDLKRAYRQIPVDPGDIHLLGFYWKNKYFIDRCAPMGLRTASLMCQRMTSALVYIHALHGYTSVNYVDDLAGVALPETANNAFTNLGEIIRNAGFT